MLLLSYAPWANDYDLHIYRPRMVPINLIWNESGQWFLSYGFHKVWAGQTDGQTDGEHSIVPFFPLERVGGQKNSGSIMTKYAHQYMDSYRSIEQLATCSSFKDENRKTPSHWILWKISESDKYFYGKIFYVEFYCLFVLDLIGGFCFVFLCLKLVHLHDQPS